MNHAFLNQLDNYVIEHRYRLINSIVVYENDELVFERYYNKFTPEKRNQIKSIWKSILSLTLGIALDKGIIGSIDDPVCRYLPSFNEDIHPYHKRMTIRHLLTMSSGIYWNGGVHYHYPMFEQLRRSRNWVEHIADVQMKALPGSVFQYKEWDVILLSAVIGAACGTSSWEYCNKHLYQPLEIKSEQWTQTKCGVDFPSYDADTTSDLSACDLQNRMFDVTRRANGTENKLFSGGISKSGNFTFRSKRRLRIFYGGIGFKRLSRTRVRRVRI